MHKDLREKVEMVSLCCFLKGGVARGLWERKDWGGGGRSRGPSLKIEGAGWSGDRPPPHLLELCVSQW